MSVKPVTVNISIDSSGVSRAGFGTLLYLSQTAGWTERVRSYSKSSGVLADFPIATAPENLVANAHFGQNPHPTKMKIGRCALAHTKVITIKVLTAVDNHDYTVVVYGTGVTTTTCTYTSDGTCLVAEVSAGLKALIDLVVGSNFGCVDNAVDTLTNTASAAGNWFEVEVAQGNLTELEYYQTHVDAGVATDLAAILNEDNDFYFVYSAFNSNAVATAIATWCEANGKVYIGDLAETEAFTTAAGNSDTADDLATASRANTACLIHPWLHEMPGAAWVGDVAWKAAGLENWANRTISGVSAVAYTDTQIANILARNASFYTTINGRSRTWKGQTAEGGGGGWLDIRRGVDALRNAIVLAVDAITSGEDKLGFDDEGGAALESSIRGILIEFASPARRVLRDDGNLTVSVPLVADLPDTSIEARNWTGITFGGNLVGAVNEVNPINGTLAVAS